jgi:hypothetical protein
MLTIALSLLVLDGLTTACLIARHHQRRRRRHRQVIRPISTSDAMEAARRANDDLARRQALLTAQRMAHPVSGTSVANGRGARPQAQVGPVDELRRAAELLAARPVLVYDPVIWET